MKGRILEILKQQDKAVISGEKISAELGISRVSIWKQINALKELGYEIDSSSKGYRLLDSPDIPFPWEIPEFESRVHYYPRIGSTMDKARDMARQGCPDFTVVVAGAQTKGRGRLKRRWLSASGGLYFTVVLKPEIVAALSHRLNFAASYTLVCIFREMFGIEALVKWPNDILVNEAKLVGILSEMETESDMVGFVNIGIGINANNDTSLVDQKAVSLKEILGREVSRKEILARFLSVFNERLRRDGLEDIIDLWKEHNVILGRHVRIVTMNEEIEGLALDVDESGALLIELKKGEIHRITYGDCFLTGG